MSSGRRENIMGGEKQSKMLRSRTQGPGVGKPRWVSQPRRVSQPRWVSQVRSLHYAFTVLYPGHSAYGATTQPHCSNAPSPQSKTVPSLLLSPHYPLLRTSVTGIIGHIRFGAGLRVRQVEEAWCPWARTRITFQEHWGKSRLRSWRDLQSTARH